ncbi:MAG: phytanoyl-CoA dioxygenase family protein [Gemmatimonadota bacterium]|nr:phytanoyl-CoA dioxygenase family protein [Gemmatimonadota bacterium]
MLSQEQIDYYHTNGYLGVEDVLSREEVEELRQVTDAFVEASRQVTETTDVFDLEPGHTPENPQLRRLVNPSGTHDVYARGLRHPNILDITAQLIGPGIRTNGDKLNMKSAEVGSPVEWHQDWAFYPHTNDDLLAVGVAIDDMTIENGCLLVIPGSHKGRIHDHHLNGRFAGAVTEPDFTGEGAVPIEIRAGGISIHHVRMLHGSAPNTSGNPRRLLLYMYCAVDAFPLVQPINTWEDFNGKILRGEPTREPRMVDVPVRLPLPPAERSGSIYEIQTVLEESKVTPDDASARSETAAVPSR